MPTAGTVFLSVKNDDKEDLIAIAKDLLDLGFKLIATSGTCHYLRAHNLPVTAINKVMEGQPHVIDAIINGQIDFMINTTRASAQSVVDSVSIRRMALMHKIPHYTLLTAARAGIQAMRAMKSRDMDVKAIQEYF